MFSYFLNLTPAKKGPKSSFELGLKCYFACFIESLASYPFNLERKKKHFLFIPNETGWKKRFSGKKKRFLVAILKFSDESWRRLLELLDVTIQYHRTWKFAIRILKISQ